MQLHQSVRRTYDHRIREHVCRASDPNLFPELRIPRSTTASWLRRGLPTVVSCRSELEDVAVLRERIHTLDTRVGRLAAVVSVQRALLRISGFSLENARLPTGQLAGFEVLAEGKGNRSSGRHQARGIRCSRRC